jgi:hypothetical protein
MENMLNRLISKIPSLIHLLIFWVGFSSLMLSILKEQKIESLNTYLLYGMAFIFVGTTSYQLFYVALYYFEPKWAMKYKINDMEWPWKTNPKRFKKTIFKQILVHVRNISVFLINSSLIYLEYLTFSCT